jgi:hypothetical protein
LANNLPVLILSSKSETAISDLFFAQKRIKDALSALHEPTKLLEARSGAGYAALDVAVQELLKQINELREVISETFWRGFIFGLQESEHEDLIGRYPEAVKWKNAE